MAAKSREMYGCFMFNWDGKVLAKSDPILRISKFSLGELFGVFYLQLQYKFFLVLFVIDLEPVVLSRFRKTVTEESFLRIL